MLCIRCSVLIPLLVLTTLLPIIVVSIAGYGFSGYRMIGVLFLYSFPVRICGTAFYDSDKYHKIYPAEVPNE